MNALSIENGPDFVRLMKKYAIDYTASHDQAVTAELMEPDYTLHMGPHVVRGRDGAYFAATRKQMDQFPGLAFTVHELWTSGERLVMRFSEHGASIRHDNRRCAWGGIGLYAWNGKRLVRNFVEQDYFSRGRQLKSGIANPVEGPAVAPWDTVAEAPDPAAETVARAWLESGALAATGGVLCDDAWTGKPVEKILRQTGIAFNDFFSCGPVVAFHIVQHGELLPDFAEHDTDIGKAAALYLAGLVHVRDGAVASGRIIRNRLELRRSIGT